MALMGIEIYSRKTIDQIVWPDTPTGRLGRDYLLPILIHGVQCYIENTDKELLILKVNDNIIPLTISNTVDHGAIFSSPFSHYLCMLPEEMGDIPLLLKMVLIGFFKALKPVFAGLRFNKVIMANNWLFTTTLYPELTADEIREATDFMIREFPDHTILWRTVYEEDVRSTTLLNMGASLVFHRTVHKWDPSRPGFKFSSDFKKDCKKLDSMDYDLVDESQLNVTDVRRMHDLYRKLYIEKHSLSNPDYTERYFQHVVTSQVLEIRAFKKNSRIDGFFAIHSNHTFSTGPFMGYDLTIPRNIGLYRILGALFYLLSWNRKLIVNASAGCGRFKKNRGCYVSLEYLGVYCKHLPWWRSIPWKVLEGFNPLVRKLILQYDT